MEFPLIGSLVISVLLMPILSIGASVQTSCRVVVSNSAFEKFEKIRVENKNATLLNSDRQLIERAYGTDVPIVHSFEAEGSGLSNIRRWFNQARPSFKTNLAKSFEKELSKPESQRPFIKWLSEVKLRSDRISDDMIDWGAMTLKERLDYILSVENPLDLFTSSQADALVETRAVTFDDITVNAKAPKGITVGDDLGSWEVRSSMGQIDRSEFLELRSQVEKFLDQKVGHQHLFHAWPQNSQVRKEIAPYYIEVLDSATWYLFWRQMKRTDTDVGSRTVVDHPYLGVYSTNSLLRLQNIVENNQPEKFKDKYRLVGARSFKAAAEIPKQKGDVPDWEIRSGNKGVMREFIEAALEARLVTGDYVGIKSFGSYDFNTNVSMYQLASQKVGAADLKVLERFEESFPMLKFAQAANAKNNYRTKILAPLLPWENRFDLNYKLDLFKSAQNRYARSLSNIGRDYLKVIRDPAATQGTKLEARKKALARIKRALQTFANITRLDLDGELYLRPRPKSEIPSIQVATFGPVDVNKVDLGIEYSVRLPVNMDFQNKQQAEKGILSFAEKFAQTTNYSKPESLYQDGHGHGVAVKYNVKDANGDAWRFEWDGIQREYKDGEVVRAYNGHIEIVTPKFSPQAIQGPILDLYQQARTMGLIPRRNAGGAHINFDIAPLKALPVAQGTRALLNLVSYFESNQEVILFMWQHPKRKHAAYPIVRTPEMAERFKSFNGDWKDLGRMLYEVRYFNTFVHRKPKYVPLNLSALMTSVVPTEYVEKTLDIKNKNQAWFPNFAKVYSRGEVRLFDAPTDEVSAALHIKYFRALMNRTFNSTSAIDLKPVYNEKSIENWKKSPKSWIRTADLHLVELGLDPKEFRSLLWESYMNQVSNTPRAVDYEIYNQYLPAKKD